MTATNAGHHHPRKTTRRNFLKYFAFGVAAAFTFDWKDLRRPELTKRYDGDTPEWYLNPSNEKEKFVAELWQAGVEMERQFEIPREVAIASAAVETQWGEHPDFKDFRKNFNWLGLAPLEGAESFSVEGKEYAIFRSHRQAFREFGLALQDFNEWAGDSPDLWRTEPEKALNNMLVTYKTSDRDKYFAAWKQAFDEVVSITSEPDDPKPMSPLIEQTQKIQGDKAIILVAGHWINPGSSLGAPGEREVNMEIANLMQPILERCGWKVRRPDLAYLKRHGSYAKAGMTQKAIDSLLKDRDNSPANYPNWSAYLNESRNLMANNPNVHWVEIHGQPDIYTLGIIASKDKPFGKTSINKMQKYLYPKLDKLFPQSANANRRTRTNGGQLNLPLHNYGVTNPNRGRFGVIWELFYSNRIHKSGKARQEQVKELARIGTKILGC